CHDWRDPVRLSIKMLLVIVMTLVILVPLSMVRGIIHARQACRAEVVQGIGRSYAGAQAFAGPVLVVPYTETVEVEAKDPYGVARKQVKQVQRQWTFFPKDLAVGGAISPSTRRRGPHEVRVYEWRGLAQASFDATIPVDPHPLRPRIICRPWLGHAIAGGSALRTVP